MREVVQTLCCAGMRKFNIATGCAVRSAQPFEVVQQGCGHHRAHNPCTNPHAHNLFYARAQRAQPSTHNPTHNPAHNLCAQPPLHNLPR